MTHHVRPVLADVRKMMNHYTTPSTYTEDTEDQNDSKYEMKELMFKLLVVGDYGVGKTAIIRRYTEGTFTQNYKITIGVDFAIKSLQWDESTLVTLQLWDIAGHERFGYMTGTYYRHSQAAIIVFDLIRFATLDSVIKWHSDIREKVVSPNGRPIPVILLANKCDIHGNTIPCDYLTQFCKKHNILAWFFTSAKENINIGEAIQYLVEKIISSQGESPYESLEVPNDSFQLTPKKVVKKKKVKCC
ncbi:ras-related protein Rab-32 [Trichonephila inaurata madagascariensis]|uniref:Ras-related protein Rab n=1 Tax=Trichonephila inaurata madagascariensis TaxID=2747483 RepID=A0A8X6XXB6_9ARAC|nr:ras-related protein Rab-32 [Trichonephila inaurata madagascariensis]